MFRFNDQLEDLFTPVMEGISKERFSYLFSHRQSMSAKVAMESILNDVVVGEGERLLIMSGGAGSTIHFRKTETTEIILGALTQEVAPLENWATYMAGVMDDLNARGHKVGAVILDGVITSYVEALAVAAFNESHDMPNPITAFYRQMRGLVRLLNEVPLIVRHPLRHDSVLPSHCATEIVRCGWHLGSRTLDQEFDAAALIYEEGDDIMAVRGKLRGGILPTGEQLPRVKL